MTDIVWLTPEETARRMALRVDQLARYVRAGKLPPAHYHFGPRTPRWRVDELDAFTERSGNTPVPRQHPSGLANALLAKFEARRQKTARGRDRR
jgi:hypothetical protein